MNRLPILCILGLLVMFVPISHGAEQADAASRLLAAGDAGKLWVVEQKSDNEFLLLFRNDAAEPEQIYRALESKGSPVAVAAAGGTLYLIYADQTAQSIRFAVDEATQMPNYPIRQLPPLPAGSSLLDLTADKAGPVILVHHAPRPPTDAAPAEESSDAEDAASPDDEDVEAAESPAPLPPIGLYRLESGRWQSLDVPQGLTGDQQLRLAFVGHDGVPTIIARATNGSVLVVHTHAGEQWHAVAYAHRVSESFDVVTPLGLCVVLDRLSETRYSAAILRKAKVLEAGSLLVPPVDEDLTAIASYRDQPAVISADPNQPKITITARDLTQASTVESQSQILTISTWPTAAFNREMMMFALLVVMTVLVIATWRRDPMSSLVELPAGLVPAELSKRVLAAGIDMIPPMAVGMILAGVADPMQVLAHWPGPTGDPADMLAGTVAIALYVLHTAITETLTGTSLGKKVVGLRVVTVKGESPNIWQFLIRNFFKIIALLIWFPLIIMAFNPARQRLGDIAGRTVVVRDADGADEEPPSDSA